MTATLIDGKATAALLRQSIATHVAELRRTHQFTPGLAVIIVGTDAASQVYVRNKVRQTEEVGMHSLHLELPATTTEEALLAHIHRLNTDDTVDGILVQLPLPSHINENAVIQAIAPEKDVDGFHVINSGKLMTGQSALVPCTPSGCLMLLQQYLGDLSGKHAVVVGRSNIVGKPMAMLLLQANCTVTIAHSRTQNLPDICRQADILVAAVGKPEMISGDWIKSGATVIDVGINRIERDGKPTLVGDIQFASAQQTAAAITPVPGGVGPMTIACLLHNTLQAACHRRDIALPTAS